MASLALAFDILARDRASATFDKVGDSVERTGSKAGMFAGALGRVAGAGALALGAAGIAGATMGLKTAAGMEQAGIAFTTMLGSAEKSKSFLDQLASFAAKTPFEFPELQTAASSLISAGVQADKVIPIMTTLGDVTSGMGTGSEGVKRATVALQQMQAAGKITGEDLNQLRDSGVPVYELLAAATGKSKEEVVKLAAAGKLGKNELDLLMKGLESGKGMERFGGLMEAQSKSLAGMWSTFTDTLNMGLAGAVEPLIPLIKDGLGGAASFLADVLPKVGSGIAGVVDWFRQAGPTVAGAGSAFGGVQSVMSAVGEWVSTKLVPRFQGIVTAVQGFVSVALPIVKKFADGMRARIEPMLPTIMGIFVTIGEIVSTAMELVQAVIERVTSVIAVVWENWGEGIMNTVAVFWGVLSGIIGAALNVVKSIISTVTALIKGDWSAVWEGLKSIVSTAWDFITTVIGAAITVVQTILSTAWAAITSVASGAWDLIKSAISGAWQAITATVSGHIERVKAVLSAAWEIIKGHATGAWEGVKGIVSRAWQAISSSVSAGAGAVFDVVRGIPGKIMGALGDLGSLLYDSGMALVRGLINGITDMAGNVARAAADVVGNAINAAKSELGISSPSRVFLEIGRQTGAGFVGGLDRSRGSVSDAMGRLLAVPAAPAFAGAGGFGGGYGGPSTITVVDSDGALIGRMRVEASGVVAGVGDMATAGRRAY